MNMKNKTTLAVQPTAWGAFDSWGCLWATDTAHARRLAAVLGEPATLWACPDRGQPWALCRVAEG